MRWSVRRRRRPLLLIATTLAFAAPALVPAGAGAAVNTVTVNSTADPGDGNCATNGCTLREAITQLDDGDRDPDRIEIVFTNPFGDNTITLASQLPTIDEPLSIASTGRFAAVVSGNNAVRPLYINAPDGTDVSIFRLTIKDGRTPYLGGGIYSDGVDLTISGSAIVANKTTGTGAGVHAGGGVCVRAPGGSLKIENSTVSDNSEAAGYGGGVYTAEPTTIERSTISGNTAPQGGGGVWANRPLTIESSTISGNSTTAPSSNGAGLSVDTGPVTVGNSTISGNSTPGEGGGFYSRSISTSPDPALSNTIVANNTAGVSGPDLESPNDTFQLSFSLVEDTSGAPFSHAVAGSNILGVDPELGPLAQNGGAALTHLPAATSPVIDKGSTDQTSDQRALARPVDNPQVANSLAAGADGADIGAVERPVPASIPGGGGPSTGGPSTGGPGTGESADLAPASLTGYRLSRSVFAAASRGHSVAARRRRVSVGTRVHYRLSEPASVRFTVERVTSGRRVSGRCVRPTRTNRRRGRCVRYRKLRGSFSHRGRQGPNSLSFTGRLAGRKLRPGRYRLVASATDGAGNRSQPKRVSFRIVGR